MVKTIVTMFVWNAMQWVGAVAVYPTSNGLSNFHGRNWFRSMKLGGNRSAGYRAYKRINTHHLLPNVCVWVTEHWLRFVNWNWGEDHGSTLRNIHSTKGKGLIAKMTRMIKAAATNGA
jgi:hypothetical protein